MILSDFFVTAYNHATFFYGYFIVTITWSTFVNQLIYFIFLSLFQRVEVNGDVEKADNEDLYHYELDITSEDVNNETDDKLITEQNSFLNDCTGAAFCTISWLSAPVQSPGNNVPASQRGLQSRSTQDIVDPPAVATAPVELLYQPARLANRQDHHRKGLITHADGASSHY